MNEKHSENASIEKIVETQEESEQDDEITLRLFADGEIVKPNHARINKRSEIA
jgi:hypothetical protein